MGEPTFELRGAAQMVGFAVREISEDHNGCSLRGLAFDGPLVRTGIEQVGRGDSGRGLPTPRIACNGATVPPSAHRLGSTVGLGGAPSSGLAIPLVDTAKFHNLFLCEVYVRELAVGEVGGGGPPGWPRAARDARNVGAG